MTKIFDSQPSIFIITLKFLQKPWPTSTHFPNPFSINFPHHIFSPFFKQQVKWKIIKRKIKLSTWHLTNCHLFSYGFLSSIINLFLVPFWNVRKTSRWKIFSSSINQRGKCIRGKFFKSAQMVPSNTEFNIKNYSNLKFSSVDIKEKHGNSFS